MPRRLEAAMEKQGSASPDAAMEDLESLSLEAAMDAPVSASLGPMGPLLRQLHSRPKGVGEDKIQLLKDVLVGLCISLKDVSEAEGTSLTAKWWMKEVRELCYATQDYLDEVFMKYSVAGARRGARLGATFGVGGKLEWRPQIGKKAQAQGKRCGASRLQKISTKKRNLKRQPRKVAISFSELMARAEFLGDVSERFELGLDAMKPDRAQAGVRRLTSHLSLQLPASPASITVHNNADGLSFVGVEEPVNKLVNLLAFDDHNQKQLKVVSIFGFPGVGKTSVATTLYRNFRGKFQCHAFLQVSRTPHMMEILTSILSQIKAPQLRGFPDAQALIDNIREHLKDKRYFIIIDDLLATSVWNIISRAFPDGDCCSRVVTTTETEDISLACCSYQLTYIFQMSPLNDDQSRKLFFSRVFGSEDGCPPEFREVSYGIIRQCGGSPLATVLVASMLAWESDLVMEQWKHIQDSLSSIVSTNPTPGGIKEVLNLIYDYLPPHLKTCLLYLTVYPDGYTIRKDDLVKQWVAEGFLGIMEEGQNKEKIAGAIFDELVSREMVQAVDTNYIGEVLFCTVHQTVLDFIRDKSMEKNFAITVDYFQSTLALSDKVRRLSIQFGGAKGAKIPEEIIISQVRSLLFFGFFKCVPLISGYGLLRVLVLHIWADEEKTIDLSRISELCRLTYLKIKCNTTIKIPAKIGGIQNLETLEIDARLSVVPSDIVHLENLLHLRLPSESYLPHGVGHMTSLFTLGYFDIGRNSENNVMDLGKLTNLKDLQLTCSTVQAAKNLEKNLQLLGSILEKLNTLQSVTLVPTADSNVNTMQDDVCAACMSISHDSFRVFPAPALLERIELLPRICIFPRLPKWFEQLGKLSTLKIAVRELWAEDIAILKALPTLTALSLYVQTAPVEIIVFDKTGFLVLSYFKFKCSTPWLKFESDAMPNLLKLKLSFNAASQVEQHVTKAISIEHLSGLKEIYTKIRGAGAISIEHLSGVKQISTQIRSEAADPERARTTTITNDKNNPAINIQLVGCRFNRNPSTGTKEIPHITQDKDKVEGEKEELNDSRNFTTQPLSSSHLLTPGSRSSKVESALTKAELQDGYVSYPWEEKAREVLPLPNSSSLLSILVLPKAPEGADSHYNSIDDTVGRANAWFLSAQASGVPVAFRNVQTEALFTKISGDMASATVNSGSLADLPNLANASLYGFEDYHGVDIGVVKAVRIWFTAAVREMPVEITLEQGDTKLGFAISRTEEGFVYISSVMEDDGDLPVPSTRSGLRNLFQEAKRASKLLVISRVSCRKVLPWMVSTSGAIRCFDTVSLSQELSLHRHALHPILLHVLMWDGCTGVPTRTMGARQTSLAFAQLRQDLSALGHLPELVQGTVQGVVAIKCVWGRSREEEWGPGHSRMVQTGDVLEKLLIRVGSHTTAHSAPFKGGCTALQKLLDAAYKRGNTSVEVHVRRPAQQQLEVDSSTERSGAATSAAATTTRMHASIVPQEVPVVGIGMVGRSGHYVLRSIRDPDYAVGLVDRLESECVAFRGSISSRMVSALRRPQLQDGFVFYPWEQKMGEVLPVPNSSSFLSILVLPKVLVGANSHHNSIDDTVARANTWFLSAQASGVPIAFLNIQTESLLAKISDDMSSEMVNTGLLADFPNLASANLYGFEDYPGVDIGMMKAVRISYTAATGEMPMEISLEKGDTMLGFDISRTKEGFVYISSVMEDDGDRPAPSTRSGLRDLYREAKSASKLLVISRVSCRNVLPWVVSTSGAIQCFDTAALKLSLHRHALRPILLHVLMWEGCADVPARNKGAPPCPKPQPSPAFAEVLQEWQDSLVSGDQPGLAQGRGQRVVVAIQCVSGESRAEAWGLGSSETVQTGDVVEELLIGVGGRGRGTSHAAPFKGGRAALQKLLHAAYKRGDTSVEVHVRRHALQQLEVDSSMELVGPASAAAATKTRMQACIVPVSGIGIGRRSRQYLLRSIRDPDYAVSLVDRMEIECITPRGPRSSRVASTLSKAGLHDSYMFYPWEKHMRKVLPVPNSSSFLSILVLPTVVNRANSVDDTLASANAWFLSSQASGVPVTFFNVQTEALLIKISRDKASATVNSGSLADLPNIANASLYCFEDFHGLDFGVVMALRIWYTAPAGEMPVEITLEEGDTKLGFAISRTEEGFVYISSVMEDDGDRPVPSTRSGLRDLFQEAKRVSKLLVISRVSCRKVLPWMVSTSGAIRCFDTVSISQKLSVDRHATRPILLHVLMWDSLAEAPSRLTTWPSPAFTEVLQDNSFAWVNDQPADGEPELGVASLEGDLHGHFSGGVPREGEIGLSGHGHFFQGRDIAGEAPFRFHNFSLPNNLVWV